jgi:hypothetical protein
MIDNIRLAFHSNCKTISMDLYSKDLFICSSNCQKSDIIIKSSSDSHHNCYYIWISSGSLSNVFFITESLFDSISKIDFSFNYPQSEVFYLS